MGPCRRILFFTYVGHLACKSLLAADADLELGGGYLCDKAQHGFHILPWKDCAISAWKDARRDLEPHEISFPQDSEGRCHAPKLKEMLRRVEEQLQIRPRQPYQQRWRYFNPQGVHIHNREGWDAAVKVGPVFLLEGGQFQWPPVRIGFRQRVEGLTNNGVQIELETLSVRPPIFRVDGLASKKETDDLIQYAKPYFRRADVVYMDHDKGKNVEEFRTSLNHRPMHNETPLIATMEARAAALTRIPASHFEEVQILEYDKGGYYHAHDDAARLEFYAKDKNAIAGHQYGYFDRMITVFWYMNTVAKGGATNFPKAHGADGPPTMKQCMQGLMVAPVRGMAVMWYNMEPRGLVDKYALHAACAVEEGDKHAINIWVYNKHRHTRPAEWQPDHPRVKEIRGDNFREDDNLEMSIILSNQAASSVDVFWHGPEKPQFLLELAPGQQESMTTFAGHLFSARVQGSSQELGRHAVAKKPNRQKFVISDGSGQEL